MKLAFVQLRVFKSDFNDLGLRDADLRALELDYVAMKKAVKRKTVAQRLAQGMAELEEAMRSGKPLHEQFTVHTMEIAEPGSYDAGAVRKLRSGLHVSQAVFAKLMGVSAELVEHWEQGVCVPRRLACRLLDEIKRDPAGFLARHVGQEGQGMRKAG